MPRREPNKAPKSGLEMPLTSPKRVLKSATASAQEHMVCQDISLGNLGAHLRLLPLLSYELSEVESLKIRAGPMTQSGTMSWAH